MSVQAYNYANQDDPGKKPRLLRKNRKELDGDDILILSTLEKLKKDLDNVHSSLDSVTDPVLIDSFIYEMNAINMRYKFYLRECKSKGLISGIF